jgi:hypothetical protein
VAPLREQEERARERFVVPPCRTSSGEYPAFAMFEPDLAGAGYTG